MRLSARLGWRFCLAFASAIASTSACAQDGGTDLLGPETLSVNGEIRLVAADGTVDKAAFLASVPAKFKAADKNGDGALSKDELMASMGPPPGAPPAQ